MEKTCLSVSEMGSYLGISRTAAYALANHPGFYPAFRIGRRVVVNVAALEKWIAEQTAAVS